MSTTPERKPLIDEAELERIMREASFPKVESAVKAVVAHFQAMIDRGELFTKEEHQRIVREREDNAMFRWSDP